MVISVEGFGASKQDEEWEYSIGLSNMELIGDFSKGT